jgi:hypothetical protein
MVRVLQDLCWERLGERSCALLSHASGGTGVNAKGQLLNLASGHVTAMLHGNGWQAHLTKNEFFSKYEVVPGEGAHATAHLAPRAGYSAMVMCWDPSNHVPCHGFDLVGALYTVLWVAGGAVSGLLGRLILVLLADKLCPAK